ncbi:MAG: hypothetical protein V1793_13000 [Pseudomonadota bacterium]
MNKAPALILVLAVLLVAGGCASLPLIMPDTHSPQAAQVQSKDLDLLFPPGSFQFVHSLEMTLPGNHSAMLMGVLNVDSLSGTVHCVVMTLEGLVLFDAESRGDDLAIDRGIPPFDNREMALGLIRDIRLVFFRPKGSPVASGYLADRQRILRFQGIDSGTVDLIYPQDRSAWILNVHDRRSRLTRSVRYLFPETPASGTAPRFPSTITLTAMGPAGYTLTMTLLEAHLIHDPNQSR